jgi:hypothetical protein
LPALYQRQPLRDHRAEGRIVRAPGAVPGRAQRPLSLVCLAAQNGEVAQGGVAQGPRPESRRLLSESLRRYQVPRTDHRVYGLELALLATGTSLNVQSMMGAIMSIGVAVANAVLLVTFARERRRAGDEPTAAGPAGSPP